MSKTAVDAIGRLALARSVEPPTSATAAPAQTVSVAPYALVRQTALSLPKSSLPADQLRGRMERMLELTRWSTRVSAELSDALHDVIASAAPGLRAVLLPLRRDVHNQRSPRLNQQALVADLADRMPLLRRWLDVRAELDRLGVELDELAEPALRADRAALAEICRSEDLRRAVALTSQDLLRAVQRAAVQGGQPDRRARKSEATVLRYALRAATKTIPLSWFARVSWGWWPNPETTDRANGRADSGTAGRVAAVAQADRAALNAVVQAVLSEPDLREELPHRLAPGVHADAGKLFFHRPVPPTETSDGLVWEEEVALPLTKPMQRLVDVLQAGGPVPPRVLITAIAERLPGPLGTALRAANTYVRQVIDQGLLSPSYPIDPQATEALAEVAQWLDQLGRAEVAAVLREIDARTAAFVQAPAVDRPAALVDITSLWQKAFALVGAASAGRRVPVTEDVICPEPLRLDARHGHEVLPDLVQLAPFLEIFDQHAVIRRLARDRFVARFGVGGSCRSLAAFARDFREVWYSLKSFETNGIIDPEGGVAFGPELQDLARLRRDLVAAIRADESSGELILPEQAVRDAQRLLPKWLRTRPTSYAVFAQPVADEEGTRLCLNHIYGGWGRFTSRFLGYFGPAPMKAVTAQIRRGLGVDCRVAQIRPVSGFNGNLHPLLVNEEISADGAGGKLLPEDLELVHDVDTDQLRLRVHATGEFLDVLYLGFLVSIVLPQRLVSLLNDHGSGLIDLTGAMVGRQERETEFGTVWYRPRLRYRNLILSRAHWRLSAATAQKWQDELDQETGLPARVAVRWRHRLGLPQRLFVSAARSGDTKGLEGFMSYFKYDKSQYVDLGSALHLRTLSRTLARYPHGVILEEALPEPQAGAPAVELVTEIYRSAA
ncbi:MAG TPA: lantibiotic dehydratase [Micromonosporaceae bacterium]|nr:lantibiotic dehydratase [Micromonosporaceae bacterium]